MAGHPTYHVNVIKSKREIIWTNRLPHLSGLPHLPGVLHLHVNRPQSDCVIFGQVRGLGEKSEMTSDNVVKE